MASSPSRNRRQWRRPSKSRSEEHTSELQSPCNLVCRLLLEKKNIKDVHDNVPGVADLDSPAELKTLNPSLTPLLQNLTHHLLLIFIPDNLKNIVKDVVKHRV